jgi:hypothetical protein
MITGWVDHLEKSPMAVATAWRESRPDRAARAARGWGPGPAPRVRGGIWWWRDDTMTYVGEVRSLRLAGVPLGTLAIIHPDGKTTLRREMYRAPEDVIGVLAKLFPHP